MRSIQASQGSRQSVCAQCQLLRCAARSSLGYAYVDGDVAYDSRVVGQSDVLGSMLVLVVAFGGFGSARLVIDNKGTLDVDVDVARVPDCGVALGRLGGEVGLVRQRRRHGGELLKLALCLVGSSKEPCSEIGYRG